jgi:hypothetical protein
MSGRAHDLIQKDAGGIHFGLGQQLKIARLASVGAASRMHQDQCENKAGERFLKSVH